MPPAFSNAFRTLPASSHKSFYLNLRPAAGHNRYLALAFLNRAPFHEEPGTKPLSGKEVSGIVSLVDGIDRRKLDFEEARTRAISDYPPPIGAAGHAVFCFSQLGFSIGRAMHGMEHILEEASRRSSLDYKFSSTLSSVEFSGPKIRAEIISVPSKDGKGFEVSHHSSQNGWNFSIPAVHATEASLYLLFERLVFSVLNHKQF